MWCVERSDAWDIGDTANKVEVTAIRWLQLSYRSNPPVLVVYDGIWYALYVTAGRCSEGRHDDSARAAALDGRCWRRYQDLRSSQAWGSDEKYHRPRLASTALNLRLIWTYMSLYKLTSSKEGKIHEPMVYGSHLYSLYSFRVSFVPSCIVRMHHLTTSRSASFGISCYGIWWDVRSTKGGHTGSYSGLCIFIMLCLYMLHTAHTYIQYWFAILGRGQCESYVSNRFWIL